MDGNARERRRGGKEVATKQNQWQGGVSIAILDLKVLDAY